MKIKNILKRENIKPNTPKIQKMDRNQLEKVIGGTDTFTTIDSTTDSKGAKGDKSDGLSASAGSTD